MLQVTLILLLLLSLILCVSATISQQWSFNNQHPLIARSNDEYSYTLSGITFKNSESSPLKYSLQNNPSWLSIDSLSGRLSGTPVDSGDTTFDIVVSDSASTFTSTGNKLPISSQDPPSLKNSTTIITQLQQFSSTNGVRNIVYKQNTDFQFTFSKTETFNLPNSENTTYYYYAFSDGNTPLPIWINFNEDGDSLVFSGTTPVVNSEIAPAQQYTLNLVASDIEGFSGVIVPFGISVGFHVLELAKNTSINISVKPDEVFNYSAPLDAIYLDGSQIAKTNISLLQLNFNSSSIPGWLEVDTKNMAIYGQTPNNTGTVVFDMQVSDQFGNSVFIPYTLIIDGVSTTSSISSTSSSTTIVSSTTFSSATATSTSSSNNAGSGLLYTSQFPTSLEAVQGKDFNYTFTESMFLNQNATQLTVSNTSTPEATWLHYSNFSLYGAVPKNFSGNITVQIAAFYLLNKRSDSEQGNTVTFTIHSIASSELSKNKKLAIILGVILPVVFIICVLLLFTFLYRRRKSSISKKNGKNDPERFIGTISSPKNKSVIGAPKIIDSKSMDSTGKHDKQDLNYSEVSSSKDEQNTSSTTFDYLSKGLLFKDRPNGVPPHLVSTNNDAVNTSSVPVITDSDENGETGNRAYTTAAIIPKSTIRKVASTASSTGFFIEKGKSPVNDLAEGISEPDDGITTKNWVSYPTEDIKDQNYVVYNTPKNLRSVSKATSETEDSDIYYDADVKKEFDHANQRDKDDDDDNNHPSNNQHNQDQDNDPNKNNGDSKENTRSENSDNDDTYRRDSTVDSNQDYSRYDSMISDSNFNDLADSILENSLNPIPSPHNESLLSNQLPSNTTDINEQHALTNFRNKLTSSRYNSLNSIGSDSANGSSSATSKSGSDLPVDTTNETSYDISNSLNNNEKDDCQDRADQTVKAKIIPKKSWRQASDSSITSAANESTACNQVTYSLRMADNDKLKFEATMQETAKAESLSRQDSGNFKHLDSRGNSVSSSAIQRSNSNTNSGRSNRNSRASGASSNEFMGKEDFNALDSEQSSSHKRDGSASGSGSGESKKSRTSGSGMINVSSSNLHVLKEEGENNTSEYFYFYDDSGVRKASGTDGNQALSDADKTNILTELNLNQTIVHPGGDSFSKIVVSPAHRVIFSDSVEN